MNIVCLYQSMSGCGNGEPGNNTQVILMPRLHLHFFLSLVFYSLSYFLFPIYSLFLDYFLFPIILYSYKLNSCHDHKFISMHQYKTHMFLIRKMDDEYKLTRKNFELALVAMGRHHDTHLVNNDGEEDGFHCSCHDV